MPVMAPILEAAVCAVLEPSNEVGCLVDHLGKARDIGITARAVRLPSKEREPERGRIKDIVDFDAEFVGKPGQRILPAFPFWPITGLVVRRSSGRLQGSVMFLHLGHCASSITPPQSLVRSMLTGLKNVLET
jgi:hypothetical protein